LFHQAKNIQQKKFLNMTSFSTACNDVCCCQWHTRHDHAPHLLKLTEKKTIA